MNNPNSKSPGSFLIACVVGLVLNAAAAPSLIAVSNALVPLVIAVAVAVVAVRLVLFHIRRW